MADKQVRVRLQVVDGDRVRKELELTGKAGEDALRKIQAAGKEPTAGVKALSAASDELHGKMQNLASSGGSVGTVLSAFGPAGIAAAAGFAVLTGGAAKALQVFAEAEKSQLRLQGVLKATGGAAGLSAAQITAFNDTLERSTFFTKENLNQAAAALATFKSVSGDTFTRTISLAADLAEVFGGDVAGAATQLGKALENPEKGLTALTRVGVTFTAAQKEQIEALMDANKQLEAQEIILKAVEGQVKGAAQAVAGGLAGAWDNLGDSIGDAFEAFGEWLNDESRITKFVNNLANGIDGIVIAAEEAATQIRILRGIFDGADAVDLKIRRSELENELKSTPDFYTAAGATFSTESKRQKLINDLNEINIELAKSEGHEKELQRLKAFDGKYGPQPYRADAASEDDPEKPKGRTKLTKARKEDTDQLGEYIAGLEEQNRLTRLSTGERKAEEAVMKAQNIARQQGKELSSDQEKQIRTLVKAQDDFTEAQKRSEEAAKLAFEPFRRGVENVQDALADMLVEGKFSFESLGDIAKKVAAEVASAWIIKPLIAPIFASAAGAVGLGGAGGAGSAAGGAGSLSTLSGGSSLLSGIMNGFNTPFLTVGQAANVGNYLGLGTGFSGGLLNFTPMAGLAGLGGGLLSSAIFGQSTGNTVGSTLGGLAGTFLGGPLGALAGSFIGGGIGSLFGGGKPSSRLQGGVIDLSSGAIDRYGLTGKKFSQENADAVTGIAQAATMIAKLVGADVSSKLAVSVSGKYGFQYGFGNSGEAVTKSFGSAGDLLKALSSELNALGDSSQSVKTALEKIDFSDVEKGLADLEFAAKFDSLGEAPKKISQLEAAFKTATETAERLGLSVSKVATAYASQFNAGITGNILAITNPRAAAIAAETDRYLQDRADALSVQGDLAQVELLHKLKLLEIEKQTAPVSTENLERLQKQQEETKALVANWGSISSSLGQTISGLRFSDVSPLSPQQQYSEASARVRDLISRGQLGDVSAANELNSFGQQFLSISRNFNGANAAFAEDFSMLENGLKLVKGTADRQASLQQQQLSATERQIEVLQSGFSGLEDEIKKLTTPRAGASTAGIGENYAGGAFAASNPNEIVIRNLAAIKAAGLYDSVEGILGSTTPGVVSGGGRRSAFYETNPFYALQATTLLKGLGIPGFASGGFTPVDQPFLVGERGPEIMQLGRQATVTPLAVNDNRRVEGLLSGLRDDIRTLIDVVIASGDQQIGLQGKMSAALASVAQRSQLLAARA